MGTLSLHGEVIGIVETEAPKTSTFIRAIFSFRHRLYVHAPLGAEHDDRTPGIPGGVDDDAHVVLRLDFELLFDEDPFHLP